MSHINDTLKRINELAAKKKSGQKLTPEELAEKIRNLLKLHSWSNYKHLGSRRICRPRNR